MTVRIEHDLLGDREIPTEAYWGIHTLRAVENFKISNQKISDVPQFVRSMVMVKKATAQANPKSPLPSKRLATKCCSKAAASTNSRPTCIRAVRGLRST